MNSPGISFEIADANARQVADEHIEHIERCAECQPLALQWCPVGQRLFRSMGFWADVAQEALTTGHAVPEAEFYQNLSASDFAVAVDKGGGAVHLVPLPISDLKTLCGIATSLLEAVRSGDMSACQGCWSPNVPLEIRRQLSSKYLRDPYESLI